jgi:hypothetical protein
MSAAPPFALSELDRRACRVQALINEGYADECTPATPALKALFLQNAEVFRRIADAPAKKTA